MDERRQSEEHRLAYLFPFAAILLGIAFLLISIASGFAFPFPIIALIILAIGITYLVVIYTARKKEQYVKGEKPTHRRKIGWVLLGVGLLFLMALPAIGIVIDIGLVFTILSLVTSFSLIIIGVIQANR